VIKKKSANVLQRKPLGEAMLTRNKEDRGMVRRLKDQLAVFKRSKDIHENRRKLDERAFYPAHDKRKETAAYKAVHEKLVKQLDLPCLVCGIKYSTLKDKTQNRYGGGIKNKHVHPVADTRTLCYNYDCSERVVSALPLFAKDYRTSASRL